MSGREHLKDCGLSTPSADDISVTIMFSYPNVHFFFYCVSFISGNDLGPPSTKAANKFEGMSQQSR